MQQYEEKKIQLGAFFSHLYFRLNSSKSLLDFQLGVNQLNYSVFDLFRLLADPRNRKTLHKSSLWSSWELSVPETLKHFAAAVVIVQVWVLYLRTETLSLVIVELGYSSISGSSVVRFILQLTFILSPLLKISHF